MANLGEINRLTKDIIGNFPFDSVGIEKAFKNSAVLNEKLLNVALEAAGKSTEISTDWAKNTFGKLQEMSVAKDDPADYAKAMTEFASTQAEVTAEKVTAFSEVAKKVQMETVEIMMSAGKNMSEEASEAVKKATKEVAATSKKVATVK
jgi:hypothetical protein